MKFEFFLARKFLRSQQMLAKFTALCAIVGIAFGLAAMIVAQALANGFRDEMQSKILENTAHLTVFRRDGEEIANWQTLAEKIKQIENVTAVSAETFDSALVTFAGNSSYAVLRGRESVNAENKAEQQKKVSIGQVLAEKIGVTAGDPVEIISGHGKFGESFAPTSTEVEVGAVFTTGLYEYDSTWILLSLADAAAMTGKKSVSANTLNIKTANLYQTETVAEKIKKQIGADYQVLTWPEANRPLFNALTLERRVASFVIVLIVLVAALNITTTLVLVINERRADIAVLRTCGAKTKSILLTFYLEGLILTAIGISGGLILGLTVCRLGNYFKLVNLSAEVYSLNYIPFHPHFIDVLLSVLLTLALSFAATILPAVVAASVRPLENLRN